MQFLFFSASEMIAFDKMFSFSFLVSLPECFSAYVLFFFKTSDFHKSCEIKNAVSILAECFVPLYQNMKNV